MDQSVESFILSVPSSCVVWHGMAWRGMEGDRCASPSNHLFYQSRHHVWYGMAWHGVAWHGMEGDRWTSPSNHFISP